MLKITIESVSQLQDEFKSYNQDNYSYGGYQVILDYYNKSEKDIELDVVAICCDWNELHLDTVISEYSIDLKGITTDEGKIDDNEKLELVLDYLNNRTYAVSTSHTIVFQVF